MQRMDRCNNFEFSGENATLACIVELVVSLLSGKKCEEVSSVTIKKRYKMMEEKLKEDHP